MLALQVQPDMVGFAWVYGVHHQGAPRTMARGHVRSEVEPGAMRGDQRVGRRRGVAAMARPAVAGGVFHHARTQRVELDVALAAQQVVIVHHRAGLVPPLPQRAGPAVVVVDVSHVSATERLHHACHLATRQRGDQQVHVVGHQHVGVDAAVLAPGDVAQILQIADVVDVGEEARLAVVAALDDVLGDAGKVDTGLAGHGRVRARLGDQSARTSRDAASDRAAGGCRKIPL